MSNCTYHYIGDIEDLYKLENPQVGSIACCENHVYIHDADNCWHKLDWGDNITITSNDVITTASIPADYTHISAYEYKPLTKIIYIHHTNCPNCGGLLDGDETKPYVYCNHCGAKIWSKREVNA